MMFMFVAAWQEQKTDTEHYLVYHQSFFTDLIQEIIREDGERSGSSLLPGPPSPPPNLRCQPNGQNQRSLRRCSSPSSEPVLLARGTPCQVSGVKNIAVRFICSSEVVCVVLIYLVSWRFPTFPRMPIHNTQRARVKVCLSGVS